MRMYLPCLRTDFARRCVSRAAQLRARRDDTLAARVSSSGALAAPGSATGAARARAARDTAVVEPVETGAHGVGRLSEMDI